MMHDGGGDRSQTVAALDLLITQLQQRGYAFATVSSAVGCPRPGIRHRAAAAPGTAGERHGPRCPD